MLSTLEQAISNVLAAKRVPDYCNVLDAYIQASEFSQAGRNMPLYFERAIEKYPDAKEKVKSPYARLITDIRKQHWNVTIDNAVRLFGNEMLLPCPCNCGSTLSIDEIRKELDIDDDDIQPAVSGKKVKRRRTTNKVKGGPKKRSGKAIPFDPFGPSTSRASM